MGKNRKLAKDIAEIILNELKIYNQQEMIDDDAYWVSNKIADSLSININKPKKETDKTKIIKGKTYIVCCENGVFGIKHKCRKGNDE